MHIEKVKRLCGITKLVFDRLVRYQNAKIRKYENEEHIMTEDSEVIIPSNEEIYAFDRSPWIIDITDRYIIMTKKKK